MYHVCTLCLRGPEGADLLELELQMIVNCLWVPGMELVSSGRIAVNLTAEPSPQQQEHYLKKKNKGQYLEHMYLSINFKSYSFYLY